MSFRPTVAATDLGAVFDGIEDDIAWATTATMQEITDGLKTAYRDQAMEAGLGRRLAYTWQGRTYPQGANSLDPSSFVFSKAPKIIDAFSRAVTIVAQAGHRYLLLDTENTPPALRNPRTRPRDPISALARQYGGVIIRPAKTGTGAKNVFVKAIAAKNKRGWRANTKRRAAQGREQVLVLMFVLATFVKLPKKVDLEGPANHWAAQFEPRLAHHLANPAPRHGHEPDLIYYDSGRVGMRSALPKPLSGGRGFTRL